MASAPIMATNLPGYSCIIWRLRSSLIISLRLQAGHFTRIDHHKSFEIENALQFAERNVQQVADAAGQTFERTTRASRGSQLDVAQALAADAGKRDFDAALVADNAAVLHALVLAA
jgi:hypothetical protein